VPATKALWSATAKLSLFVRAWTILGDDSQPSDGESGSFAAALQKRYALAKGRWPAGNRRHSASVKGWRQFQPGTQKRPAPKALLEWDREAVAFRSDMDHPGRRFAAKRRGKRQLRGRSPSKSATR
jgi:hypothetical protein